MPNEILYFEGRKKTKKVQNRNLQTRTTMDTTDITKALLAPMDLTWKPNNRMGADGYLWVPYIDARDVQKRLDDVLGFKWKAEHYGEAGKIFCRISILIDGEWISRTDAGHETQVEADKGAASTAFRRAAAMFGVGRFIYQVDPIYTRAEQRGKNVVIISDDGEFLVKNKDKFDYLNEKAGL